MSNTLQNKTVHHNHSASSPSKSVTLIGCGWFGLPLAKALFSQGYQVRANKRLAADAAALSAIGVSGFELDLANVDVSSAQSELGSYFDSDVLIVNIPPGLRRGETQYLSNLHNLQAIIGPRQYQRVIFISTTGVYPANDTEVTEVDATAHSAGSEILLQAEQMFAKMDNACIVRFAGLVGPKRHPGRFFAGKKDITGGNIAVNLVHLNDCVTAVLTIVAAPKTAPVYNLCAPIHPRKDDFYTQACRHLGQAEPTFSQQLAPSKVINAQLICQQLGFSYQFSDPITMLDAC